MLPPPVLRTISTESLEHNGYSAVITRLRLNSRCAEGVRNFNSSEEDSSDNKIRLVEFKFPILDAEDEPAATNGTDPSWSYKYFLLT